MMTLENIMYARAFSHEQQDSLITSVAARMVEDQFALLIIDSFTSLFRVEFVGREELAPRQQAIACMMNKLSKLATEFNIAVVITKYAIVELPIPKLTSLADLLFALVKSWPIRRMEAITLL
jgi:meiotic recombination protein DMC1